MDSDKEKENVNTREIQTPYKYIKNNTEAAMEEEETEQNTTTPLKLRFEFAEP